MKWINCKMELVDTNGVLALSVAGDFEILCKSFANSFKTDMPRVGRLLDGKFIINSIQLVDGDKKVRDSSKQIVTTFDGFLSRSYFKLLKEIEGCFYNEKFEIYSKIPHKITIKELSYENK